MRLYILLGVLFVAAGLGAWTLRAHGLFPKPHSDQAKESGAKASFAATPAVKPTGKEWPLAFDRYHFAVGDRVGSFLITNGEASTPPAPAYPYPEIDITLSGTTTIIGTLDANRGEMCGGTYIQDITPETAATLPRPSDEQAPSAVLISDDSLAGADTVYNGDTVSVPITELSIEEAPKDCGGYMATAHSIKLVQTASAKPYLTGAPAIKQLRFNIPAGWHMTDNSDTGVTIVSPDFSTRQTLADILKGAKPWVTSGRQISIAYQAQHLSPDMSAQGFVDFEKGVNQDCSNCEAAQDAMIGALPAVLETAVEGPDSWTTVSASNHSDEVDVTFEPAIRSDADRAFMQSFLSSISFAN